MIRVQPAKCRLVTRRQEVHKRPNFECLEIEHPHMQRAMAIGSKRESNPPETLFFLQARKKFNQVHQALFRHREVQALRH